MNDKLIQNLTPNPPVNNRERLHFALLTLAAVIVLFTDASAKELHGTAVFYASLVREIVASGSWMGIYSDEHAYLLKPPLVVWLSALGAHAFGLDNFGVTFISRAAGVGCVMLSYVFMRRWWRPAVAWLGAFALLTNSTFVQFTATLRMDSALLFGMLLALVGWAYRDEKWAAAALFGGVSIAVLSKGPLGFAVLPLIACHALMVGRAPIRAGAWPWAILLVPIIAWYGALYGLHGDKPFAELGADTLRASAAPEFDRWQSVTHEYLIKPLRRYWPWLPFMLFGAALCIARGLQRQATFGMRKTYWWLLLWVSVVIIGAILKPDHDIRYFYPALPALGLFTGLAIEKLMRERWPAWLPFAALALVFVATFLHGKSADTDTRASIAQIRDLVAPIENVYAIGGFPVPPTQARRQNTHRDWVHFYTGRVPKVLDWNSVEDANIDFAEGVLMTRSRGHKQRLEQFGLVAKHTTKEMIYAVAK